MKLSIITVNLNNKLGLEKTLSSVQEQKCKEIEHIVIDGGSHDGSVELIPNYPHVTRFLCEGDQGIYDAMNKGILISKGDYLLFLNSGDIFDDMEVLKEIIPQLNGEDLIYGDVRLGLADNGYVKRHSYNLTFNDFFFSTLCHQSTFIKSVLFQKHGLYRTDFKIVSDWAFFIDILVNHQASYKYINIIVSRFDTNGLSSNPENHALLEREKDVFLKNNFSFYYDDYVKLAKLKNLKRSLPFKILKFLRIRSFNQDGL